VSSLYCKVDLLRSFECRGRSRIICRFMKTAYSLFTGKNEMRILLLLLFLGMIVLLPSCRKAPKETNELPRYRDAILDMTELTTGRHTGSLLYLYGNTDGPNWRTAKPSCGFSSPPLYYGMQWQYLGTTDYGDIYELNLTAKEVPHTPPIVTRHVGYAGKTVTVYENESVRVVIRPRGQ